LEGPRARGAEVEGEGGREKRDSLRIGRQKKVVMAALVSGIRDHSLRTTNKGRPGRGKKGKP